MSTVRGQVTAAGSMLSGLPLKMEASSAAASRLCDAATEWKSPLKWRLMSSIGSIIALPPPVPPPLTPNTGPIDGSRRQSITFLSMRPSPCVSATLVVVLPSPALVGVIAVTMTSLPSALAASRRSSDSLTLARNSPKTSSSSDLMPAVAAMSAIGRSCTWDASDTTLISDLLQADLKVGLYQRRTTNYQLPTTNYFSPSRTSRVPSAIALSLLNATSRGR